MILFDDDGHFSQDIKTQRRFAPMLSTMDRNHCPRSLEYAYIHLTPIEAGLVANPEDYPWSSYGACLDPNLAPAWLLQDKILRCFAGADHYMRFVQEGMQEKLPNPLEVAKGGIAFGDEVFVRQIRLLQRDPLRIPTSRACSKWR